MTGRQNLLVNFAIKTAPCTITKVESTQKGYWEISQYNKWSQLSFHPFSWIGPVNPHLWTVIYLLFQQFFPSEDSQFWSFLMVWVLFWLHLSLPANPLDNSSINNGIKNHFSFQNALTGGHYNERWQIEKNGVKWNWKSKIVNRMNEYEFMLIINLFDFRF